MAVTVIVVIHDQGNDDGGGDGGGDDDVAEMVVPRFLGHLFERLLEKQIPPLLAAPQKAYLCAEGTTLIPFW